MLERVGSTTNSAGEEIVVRPSRVSTAPGKTTRSSPAELVVFPSARRVLTLLGKTTNGRVLLLREDRVNPNEIFTTNSAGESLLGPKKSSPARMLGLGY